MSRYETVVTRRRLLGQAALAAATGTMVKAGISAGTARAAAPPVSREHVPAVVIGSGYGGSVAALRLGQAGVQTLVLEMGRLWNKKSWDGLVFCRTLVPDGRAMWFENKTQTPLDSYLWIPIDVPIERSAGILDRLQFKDMAVYCGHGVGGGSLINGAVALTPRRVDFERFMPNVDADQMYGTFFPRANAALGVNQVPRDWFEKTKVHQYSRVGRASAENAGFKTTFVPSVYDYDYLQKEALGQVARSATAQEIYYGSNHGKRSLDKTYLAEALGTGNVSIAALSRVSRIREDGHGSYVVDVEEIALHGQVMRRREIACEHLFLGAGTMGTNKLLLRAQANGDLPNLSDQIGRGWGNNGDISVSAFNPLNKPTGVIQSTMPALAIDNRDDPNYPCFFEVSAQPIGFENFTTSYLGVTDSGERANLTYDPAKDDLHLDWKASQADGAVAAVRHTLDRVVNQNKMLYRTDLYKGNQAFGTRSTWHPLGGCVLGQATDLFGRLDGYRNLYVTDGSLLPGFASVNPFVTITAMAERIMDRVVAEDILS